jgi:DNA polymerase-3 subunit beta
VAFEIEIKTTDLREALGRAKPVAKAKKNQPILGSVKLTAEGSRLSVAATDLEVGLVTEHPAQVKKAGAVCIDAGMLGDMASKMPGETVRIATEENGWVRIKSGKVSYRLVAQGPEMWPAMESGHDARLFGVEAPMLRSMIERTIYAASTDETRHNLCGVLVEPMGKGLRMVSTDGHRLAVLERPIGDDAVLPEDGVTLPRKGLEVLRKLLGEVQGVVQFGVTSSLATVNLGEMSLTMRLVDGKFPAWRQVLPSPGSRRAVVNRDELGAALKRAGLLAEKDKSAVAFEFTEGAPLVITASNPDKGQVREEIEAEYHGETIKAGYNGGYIAEALGAVVESSVEWLLVDDLSPSILRGAGAEDYRAIVMPMRL